MEVLAHPVHVWPIVSGFHSIGTEYPVTGYTCFRSANLDVFGPTLV